MKTKRRIMNSRTVMCWTAILVAVDILVTMIVLSWAISVLPEGWWSVGTQTLLITVVGVYIAVIGALMLVGYCIKRTAGSIYSRLCAFRSMCSIHHMLPISHSVTYVHEDEPTVIMEETVPEDTDDETGYGEGYSDGYTDGHEAGKEEAEYDYARGYSEGFRIGYDLDVRNR